MPKTQYECWRHHTIAKNTIQMPNTPFTNAKATAWMAKTIILRMPKTQCKCQKHYASAKSIMKSWKHFANAKVLYECWQQYMMPKTLYECQRHYTNIEYTIWMLKTLQGVSKTICECQRLYTNAEEIVWMFRKFRRYLPCKYCKHYTEQEILYKHWRHYLWTSMTLFVVNAKDTIWMLKTPDKCWKHYVNALVSTTWMPKITMWMIKTLYESQRHYVNTTDYLNTTDTIRMPQALYESNSHCMHECRRWHINAKESI